jgi:hypothetical protein
MKKITIGLALMFVLSLFGISCQSDKGYSCGAEKGYDIVLKDGEWTCKKPDSK